MTKEFNSCAHLMHDDNMKKALELHDDLLKQGKNPLDFMLELQKSLQIKLHNEKPEGNPNPDKLETCGEIANWIRNQDQYIADENIELLTALGGMSNGSDASAIWKPWKSKHVEAKNRKWEDLSDEDKLETLFELIDIWHFFMNKMLPFGLDAKTIFALYCLKNSENIDRQARGY